MELEKSYMFNGVKFLDYISDPHNFAKKINKKLGINQKFDLNFSDYYEQLMINFRQYKTQIDKIFFEEIMYGRLTQCYSYKLKTLPPNKTIFLKNVNNIIDTFKVNVAVTLQSYMTSGGFYIMDVLNITDTGKHFICGFDFIEENNKIQTARFLIGRTVVRRKDKTVNGIKSFELRPEYWLAGIDIDFRNKSLLVLQKHATGIQEDDDEDEKKNTPALFHNFIFKNVIQPLNVITTASEDSGIKDQRGMSIFCKELFNDLTEDIRQKTKELTNQKVDRFSVSSTNLLNKELDKSKKITRIQRKEFSDKIHALLFGMYILNFLNEKDMADKAKTLELVGFPTKIEYQNSRLNKSSTGTGKASKSIASSDTLYSLLTDFEGTSRLEKWSMSWFTEQFQFDNHDPIQTTIEARTNYFKITFNAYRHLNKELIYHVINKLNFYRNH